MVLLITGASHVGKTALAQALTKRCGVSHLCIDHLKMGLIRSGHTALSPLSSDGELTALLWPIVREIIKTAVENGQDLIVEGCYVPADFERDFSEEYRAHLRLICLAMTKRYVKAQFDKIAAFANVAEKRLCDELVMEDVLSDNESFASRFRAQGQNVLLIDAAYEETLWRCADDMQNLFSKGEK